MNKQIQQQWVDALRSGEYRQTQYRLRLGNRFCVLGVLCDLYAKEFDIPWTQHPPNEIRYFLGEKGVLPWKVIDWSDIIGDYSREGSIIPGLNMTPSHLNDTGSTFLQLADLIEARL